MGLLYTTTLYYGSTWLYFNLLDSTVALLDSTLLHSTVALLYSTTLYYGST